ncbi:MAG TPA: YfhO family protein, partial [Candidatus Dormibacteraeota bacterium]|nr:YfhO family protein [Candidatus Dormibacteraeota bacterium]
TVYISTNQMPPTQWLVDSGVSEVLALAGQPMGNGLTSQPLTDSITAWSPPGPTPGRAYLISGTDRIPANVTSDSGEQLTVQIPGRASGNLILTDTYYPGWSATVDGRPVSISRYEGFFRSVSVPVGAKQVVFSYESKPLELGLAISVMSLILGFGLGLYPSVWRRIKGRVARASAVSG